MVVRLAMVLAMMPAQNAKSTAREPDITNVYLWMNAWMIVQQGSMKSSSASNVQNAMIPVSFAILLPQIASSVEISQALSTSYMITNVWWNALMGTGETSQPINVKHAGLSVQHASAIQPNNAIHVPTVMV